MVMWLSNRKKVILRFACLVLILFCIPFNINKSTLFGSETTIYKAVLYSVVRVDVMGLKRTKVYFFPSNFDANNNFEVVADYSTEINDHFSNFANQLY